VRRLRAVVDRFTESHQPCVVHARSYVPAWAALRAKGRGKCLLVFDPRGSLPEELRDANGWGEHSRRYLWWRRLEASLLGEADVTIGVSRPMAEHFRSRGAGRTLVVRNCVDLERFRSSARTPREDEPLRLIFLVGVDAPYQAAEESAAVRSMVARSWPGGATLRVISPDADSLRLRLRDECITSERLPRQRIPEAVSQSDIGLLVRDRTAGRTVACPVKFAEYLAAGLPVIASPGIGEIDALLRQCRLGVSIDPSDHAAAERLLLPLLARIRDHREPLRAAARRAAEQVFSWDVYLPRLFNAYGLPGA
jgi:glycosyltransferase involved in cell wall biosynthesis